MKTITKYLMILVPAILLSAASIKAQCVPGFTWTQPSNNVIAFTNTSNPIIPNSAFFTWNFGDNQYDYQQDPTHTYNVPGNYIVCLTFFDSLSGCQSSMCDTITVTGNVICTMTVDAIQSQNATCSTCPDGVADAYPLNGTSPFTYSWNNGETNQTATMLPPGIAIVSVWDVNGCVAYDTVSIMFTNSSSCQASYTTSQTQNNIVDFTSTSTGTSAGTYYVWDFGDNQGGISNAVTHTYTNPGTYLVCLAIYDSLSSCQSYFCDSVVVTGIYACNVSVHASVSQPATCITCPDGIAYATMTNGVAPYTYTWSNSQTTQYASGLAPGSYTVCMTDAHGCNSCDTIMLDTTASCYVTFNYSQTANNPVQFTASGYASSTMSIMWSFGDNTGYVNGYSVTHTYPQSGTYYVCATVSDSSWCSSTFCDSVTVIGNPNPNACLANFAIYPDTSVGNLAWAYNLSVGSPGMTYVWNWGDNTTDSIPYPSHVYQTTGTYNICLIVNDLPNQCADTMCQAILVVRLSQAAASAPYYVNVVGSGIHEQAPAATWSLFPNPAQNEVRIKTDYSLQGKQFLIVDISGRTVSTGTIDGSSIDISSFDKGMYILQIENSTGGFSAQRFIKD